MRKIHLLLTVLIISITQPIFAGTTNIASMNTNNDACATVANACNAAGFVQSEASGKNFWIDCMKPVILGRSVNGISVAPKVANNCRVIKIKQLKSELKTLQHVKR